MLLWAGRDCLPKMFDDARQESSAAEQAFDEYMRNVEMLRRNEPIYGGNAGATHFHDRRAAAAGPWYAIDPGTALLWGGMLLVDVAVVVWLFRKWRHSAT
jgi:hypothetical protein